MGFIHSGVMKERLLGFNFYKRFSFCKWIVKKKKKKKERKRKKERKTMVFDQYICEE